MCVCVCVCVCVCLSFAAGGVPAGFPVPIAMAADGGAAVQANIPVQWDCKEW